MSDMTQQLRSIANQSGASSCSGALRTAADIIDKMVERKQLADTLADLANRTDLDRNQLRGKLINLAAYYRNGGAA